MTEREHRIAERLNPEEIAADVVQSIADSLPDDDTIGAQELLAGTEYESMYVLHGHVIERHVAAAIENACDAALLRDPEPGEGLGDQLLEAYAALLRERARDPEPGEPSKDVAKPSMPTPRRAERMMNALGGERRMDPDTGAAIRRAQQAHRHPAAPREAEGQPDAWMVESADNSTFLGLRQHRSEAEGLGCRWSIAGEERRAYQIVPLYRAPEPVQPEPDGELRERIAAEVRRAAPQRFISQAVAFNIAGRILDLTPLATVRARVEELEWEIAEAREACQAVRMQDFFGASLLMLVREEVRQLHGMQARAEAAELEVGRLRAALQRIVLVANIDYVRDDPAEIARSALTTPESPAEASS